MNEAVHRPHFYQFINCEGKEVISKTVIKCALSACFVELTGKEPVRSLSSSPASCLSSVAFCREKERKKKFIGLFCLISLYGWRLTCDGRLRC